MRAIVRGDVVDIEDASWTNQQGQRMESWDVYVKQAGSGERYGADRVSCRPENKPEKGAHVEMVCVFQAKESRAGKPYLSVFCVDMRVVARQGVQAVPPVKAAVGA